VILGSAAILKTVGILEVLKRGPHLVGAVDHREELLSMLDAWPS
jgi:hypothetical protein